MTLLPDPALPHLSQGELTTIIPPHSQQRLPALNRQPPRPNTQLLPHFRRVPRPIRSKLLPILLTLHEALQRLQIRELGGCDGVMVLDYLVCSLFVEAERCDGSGARGGGVELLEWADEY